MSEKNPIYVEVDSRLKRSASGATRIAYNEDVIDQSIRSILSTITGERVRNPIGSTLVGLLFRPITPQTARDIKAEISDKLVVYEPRLLLGYVSVTPNYDSNYYDLVISYRVKGLGPQNYTFNTNLKGLGA